MGTIQLKHLTFRYPGASQPVFDHLSVNLDDHWKLGLIGRNGRGKTTFLQLLRGQLVGDGDLIAPQRFTYFPTFPVDPTQTVMTLLTATGAPAWRASIELAKIGLAADTEQRSFTTLSGGEQTRVLLAQGFVNDAAFPLIDEPTNHLDITGRELVGRYLKRKQGFICVSHDQAFLDSFVDHVLALNRRSVDLIAGNVTTWQADKAHRDAAAEAQNDQLRHEIRRLDHRATTQRNWAEQKENASTDAFSRRTAQKLMKRAKSFEHRAATNLAARQGLLTDVETPTQLTTSLQTGNGHQLLFSLRNFQLDRQGRPLFAPLDLDFHQGDQLALIGPNGSGKTSLLSQLCRHEDLPYTGYLINHLPSDIAYLAQDFTTTVHQVDFATMGTAATRTTVWNLMHQLGVARNRLRAPVSEWSMGEAKKAALALTLCAPHALLVWDEPTNYLDLDARNQLITLLRQLQPTIILVDHDRRFIQQACSQEVHLTKV